MERHGDECNELNMKVKDQVVLKQYAMEDVFI